MLLTSSQPMPPLLPPSSPALSRFLLLMCSCLLRCVQLMALPRWLVGRFRPLCTNVLAAARRASCLRGLAGGLSAFVTILLEFIVEEGSSSEVRPRQVEPIRCTRAAAECPCERADGQPVRAHLARSRRRRAPAPSRRRSSPTRRRSSWSSASRRRRRVSGRHPWRGCRVVACMGWACIVV